MGMTTGMMMGNMLSMNQMNMGDYFADMDYANDMGYADGSGGAMPAEGGDFADGWWRRWIPGWWIRCWILTKNESNS